MGSLTNLGQRFMIKNAMMSLFEERSGGFNPQHSHRSLFPNLNSRKIREVTVSIGMSDSKHKKVVKRLHLKLKPKVWTRLISVILLQTVVSNFEVPILKTVDTEQWQYNSNLKINGMTSFEKCTVVLIFENLNMINIGRLPKLCKGCGSWQSE